MIEFVFFFMGIFLLVVINLLVEHHRHSPYQQEVFLPYPIRHPVSGHQFNRPASRLVGLLLGVLFVLLLFTVLLLAGHSEKPDTLEPKTPQSARIETISTIALTKY